MLPVWRFFHILSTKTSVNFTTQKINDAIDAHKMFQAPYGTESHGKRLIENNQRSRM
jgi:hypothetical protein